jgi:hypothetical protein
VEFVTILLMDTNESIRSFAGPDYETSVIPEERPHVRPTTLESRANVCDAWRAATMRS